MPLAAKIDGALHISSRMTESEWSQLKSDVRARRRSITMRCGQPGIARTSKLGTRHFAHSPGGDGCTTGETKEHLLAKAAIIDGIVSAGWTPEPEAPGDGWIADVLAKKDGQRAVFEVQWSRQTLENYRFRQVRYEASGIRSVAWFSRHTQGLPRADRALQVLPLEIEEGQATVTIEGAVLGLAEVVERLLVGRMRLRDFVFGSHRVAVTVDLDRIECHRCNRFFAIWDVASLIALGNCGVVASRESGMRPSMRSHRYEELPAVQELAAEFARSAALRPARLALRKSRTAEKTYMAFVCPFCDSLCGETFVHAQFRNEYPIASVESEADQVPVHEPHWCVEDGEGLCREPLEEWAESLRPEHPGRPIVKGIPMSEIINIVSGRSLP